MSVAEMTDNRWVYLNGAFVQGSDARISPFDRGFLFAHAAYEVTAVFDGKLIDYDAHMARLAKTLEGIEILAPEQNLAALHAEIIARNNLTEGLVYMQVSAGAHGPRDFYGPEDLAPSLFMFTTAKTLIGEVARDGFEVISLADTRWARRDVKTTQLLSQTLAYRAARRAGVDTAILHEDGVVTEAASANAWIVTPDGVFVTRENSPALLPGITRTRGLQLLRDAGFQVEERSFTLNEMAMAAEAFTTSTGAVIAPILRLDGKPIGTGSPGPMTRTLQQLYYTYIGADLSVSAPWAL